MPVSVRRFIYGLLTALGFVMMVPLMLASRRLEAEIMGSRFDLETGFDLSSAPGLEQQTLLFFAGLALAAGFLYAALTTGTRKGWRPQEDGAPRCSRCGAEIPFAVTHCPACDQRLSW
ncbi:MAG: hypothetical protein JSV86_03610 [Gemmatimonadota bacterium]|nr:MAG: hypothetical protein JSV86_03610 [Gemmatimonadota bacterium]